jgi:hypothetical protein
MLQALLGRLKRSAPDTRDFSIILAAFYLAGQVPAAFPTLFHIYIYGILVAAVAGAFGSLLVRSARSHLSARR